MASGSRGPSWIGEAVARALPSRGVLFVSDVHIGAGWGDPDRESTLCALLETLDESVQDIVLGGDIFEFWYEWQHVQPRLGQRLLACLELLSERHRIWMIRGNHDFGIGPVMAGYGIFVLEDGLCLDVAGKRWLFLHGDGMAPSDRLDRLVRRVLRHRLSQWAWRHLLHPDWAMRLALGTGKASRKANPGPAPNLEEYEDESFRWMECWDLAGVVHGHTHRPHQVDRGGRKYVNNGDWCLMRSRVWIGPEGPQLETFA
jgi:UDP-2,3-diacylglucosamine hydrolase